MEGLSAAVGASQEGAEPSRLGRQEQQNLWSYSVLTRMGEIYFTLIGLPSLDLNSVHLLRHSSPPTIALFDCTSFLLEP